MDVKRLSIGLPFEGEGGVKGLSMPWAGPWKLSEKTNQVLRSGDRQPLFHARMGRGWAPGTPNHPKTPYSSLVLGYF
jgi:hypothetical protein